jgi:hypothetical protein
MDDIQPPWLLLVLTWLWYMVRPMHVLWAKWKNVRCGPHKKKRFLNGIIEY